MDDHPGTRRLFRTPPSRVGAGCGRGSLLTAVMPRDQPAAAMAACAGCAALWRGMMRAHCRGCHVAFDDEVRFDAHRRTAVCVPPHPSIWSWWMVRGVGCWRGSSGAGLAHIAQRRSKVIRWRWLIGSPLYGPYQAKGSRQDLRANSSHRGPGSRHRWVPRRDLDSVEVSYGGAVRRRN
jgi:hypothetical protein